MRHLTWSSKRRLASLLGACVLLAGGGSASVLFAAGPADAAACATGTPTTTNCTDTATATLTGGSLTLAASGTLGWTATLTGLAQNLVDGTAGDQVYTVDDARGTGAGWNVTASATTFTSTTPAATLPNTGTFSTTGSVTSATATTAPTTACNTGATGCTLPTTTTTFPVAITTAATSPVAVAIYNAGTSTGLGSIDIGGSTSANPAGWWIVVPANATAATYTSTVTLTIATGP